MPETSQNIAPPLTRAFSATSPRTRGEVWRRGRFAIAVGILFSTSLHAADAPPGAASCSGCHPAHKNADTLVPRLIGLPATDIAGAMRAFRAGQRPATIMDRIAKGFTDEEIDAISQFYATQKD